MQRRLHRAPNPWHRVCHQASVLGLAFIDKCDRNTPGLYLREASIQWMPLYEEIQYRRVWFTQLLVTLMEHCVKLRDEQLLTTMVKVLECGEHKVVCCSQCMVVFVLLFSLTWIVMSFMYMKCIFTLNQLVQVS